MQKGKKCLLCRMCFHFNSKKEKKDGFLHKATTPSAHKTADHKTKVQNLAMVIAARKLVGIRTYAYLNPKLALRS